MNKKYFLTFHTVFILNENIKWLEEFLIYYINVIGIEHFYLYDNDGSTGYDGTKDANKYGFAINTTNKEDDKLQFEYIKNKYNKYITHIIWQPKDKNGNIIYGQNESIKHYITNYGNNSVWTCFLDLDEFIYSPQNIHLPTYLSLLDDDVSCITICQKKFIDRFLSKQKFITQNTLCIDKEIGTEWAPKNIIKNDSFIDIINIHIFTVKNKTLVIKLDEIRFNHYNVNNTLLIWMKSFYNNNINYSLNSHDTGMLKYKYLISTLTTNSIQNNYLLFH
jgi:hypothetical protein